MKRTLTIAIAAALSATACSARAVMLNPRGTGQVLIYPYYTVNHQQTLVSVINTTAHGKALKLRFREGYDGRDVANFNVYLGPYDSWVGAVYDTSADGTGAAAIATNDNSCTVPAFPLAPVPGTLHALPFTNANYSQGDYGMPTGTDSGPIGLVRTREGFFEIIEMGEVVDQASGSSRTLEAITPVNGLPPGCAQIHAAWAAGGYWRANPGIDLLPPAGGVYGAGGIVDVAEGTLYAYDATAVDGFSDVAQHTGPGDSNPNFGTAVTDSAQGLATAYVPIGNAMTKSQYPSATRGVDAVSAVLAADRVFNEFLTDPAVGASSEWVVTFPTKQFYVDPAIVGATATSYLPPFEETFGGGNRGFNDPGVACNGRDFRYFDREGDPPPTGICTLCPIPHNQYLCYEAELLTFNQQDVEPGVASRIFGSLNAINFSTYYANGWFDLSLSINADEALRPSLEGNVFAGQPVVGFLAVNYINANVTPGVLSNYSAVYPHRSTATCTNSTNTQNICK
ncbi:MAG TPA: hypothetical protein VLC97_11220 [Rhodanobacteraceae bacterium]|nr:hypothetical protein [Rhodanobacteraceae bacterium]